MSTNCIICKFDHYCDNPVTTEYEMNMALHDTLNSGGKTYPAFSTYKKCPNGYICEEGTSVKPHHSTELVSYVIAA